MPLHGPIVYDHCPGTESATEPAHADSSSDKFPFAIEGDPGTSTCAGMLGASQLGGIKYRMTNKLLLKIRTINI